MNHSIELRSALTTVWNRNTGIDKQTDGYSTCRCDHRMLRYMAGVRWQDGRSSSEVAKMCEVEDLSVKLRQRRLRWFGHVKRGEKGVLAEVEEVRLGGQQPVFLQ